MLAAIVGCPPTLQVSGHRLAGLTTSDLAAFPHREGVFGPCRHK